jgi:sigma-E factor negative regulatory protein RseB
VTTGGIERVAGYECQSIVLEPKDKIRYGRKLWADANTGMLLKSQTFNDKKEVVEQFAFTQISIGGKIDQGQLKSRFLAKSREWRVENSGAVSASLAASGWTIDPELPGFRKITEMKRTQGGSSEVGHVVYSDGLAAVSVFIEPMSSKTALPQPGLSRQGAINIYSRQIAGHLVTVVGEAPAASVKMLAEAVEYRKP